MSVQSLKMQIENLTRFLPYQRRTELQQQVSLAMVNVQTLRLSVENHSFPDGRNQKLLKMCGTIPINYKGNTYNIPITIWFEYSFPQIPPLCYVTPTPDMAIQSNHRHVDTTGKMYLQRLHSWSFRSNLTDLIFEMTTAFSKQPPVYAKPKKPARAAQLHPTRVRKLSAAELWKVESAARASESAARTSESAARTSESARWPSVVQSARANLERFEETKAFNGLHRPNESDFEGGILETKRRYC